MSGDKKLRILVVDDEKVIRDFFKRVLSLLNAEVFEAEDGLQAVELARANEYDVFFLDVRMPGIDGLETFRQIRRIHPQARVVMMTGYAVDDILKQAQDEGASQIIRKPFDITELKVIIDRLGRDKRGKVLSILVIDDEEIILDFFSNLLSLKKLNYRLVKVKDKDKALKALKEEKFDLVFLDLVLAECDGIELYRQIKNDYPSANVVLITGHKQKAEEAQAQAEITEVLSKPFDIAKIIECIDRVREKV